MNALSSLYGEVLADLNDAAWLAACNVALRTCTFFPTPAELVGLADDAATTIVYERVAAAERQRIASAEEVGRLMLTSGRLTPERAAENADAIADLSSSLDAIRAAGASPESRDEFWSEAARHRIRQHRHLNRNQRGSGR